MWFRVIRKNTPRITPDELRNAECFVQHFKQVVSKSTMIYSRKCVVMGDGWGRHKMIYVSTTQHKPSVHQHAYRHRTGTTHIFIGTECLFSTQALPKLNTQHRISRYKMFSNAYRPRETPLRKAPPNCLALRWDFWATSPTLGCGQKPTGSVGTAWLKANWHSELLNIFKHFSEL